MCVCVFTIQSTLLASSSQEWTLELFHIDPAHRKQPHISTKDQHGTPNTLLIVVQKHFCLSFLGIPFLWGAAWKANCQVIGFFLSLFSLRKCAKLSFKGAASMLFLLPKSSVQTHNLFIQAEIYNQTFSVPPSDSVFLATSEVNS